MVPRISGFRLAQDVSLKSWALQSEWCWSCLGCQCCWVRWDGRRPGLALSGLMVQKALREEPCSLIGSPHSPSQTHLPCSLCFPSARESLLMQLDASYKSNLISLLHPQKCRKLLATQLLIINPNLLRGNQEVLRKVGPTLLVACLSGAVELNLKISEIPIRP